jgi:ABC-2 type transport system permease protein
VQRYIASEIEKSLDKYKIRAFNLDKDTYERIKDRLAVNTVDFKKKTDDKFKMEITLVGFFFAVLIYMFIFMYGVQVMRGVIEEKTNRIVEIIISSVKPFQLMMGKIVGIALVGLTQFLLWIILSAGLIFAAQSFIISEKYDASKLMKQQMTSEMMKESSKEIPLEAGVNDVTDLISRINFPLMFSMFVFYFLGGYLLYASLFAAVGAAVDSEADTQQFMAPITIPLVFGFIVAEFAIQNPEGTAAFWFSIIPFTSPVVMMVRVASGIDSGDIWQVYLSMFILVASFIFTTWLAGRIYRTGILMYGKKASYKELWKWLFYKS